MRKLKRTAETNIKIIQKLTANIGGTNKRRESKSIRELRKFPQELLRAAGLDPSQFSPANVVRVWVYGTAGRMYSDTENIEQEMRARDEYYNRLVRVAKSVLHQYNSIVDGPQQLTLRNASAEIEARYAAIRAINQKQRKRVSSPEVEDLLAKIKTLKKERNPLFKPAREERRSTARAHKDELAALQENLFKVSFKALRAARPADLWHGNYRSAEKDFKTAWKKAIEGGTEIHLRHEWKGEAENVLDTKRWNGEGAITSLHSTVNHERQEWGQILAGENPYLQVRKLVPTDLENHGLKPTYRIDGRHYLVSVRLREGWVSLPVFLHRLPTESDRILESSFIVKKAHLWRRTYFHMAVSFPLKPSGRATVSVIPVWERQQNGTLVFARWRKDKTSGVQRLPASIGMRILHAMELHGHIDRHLAAVNDERIKRGLADLKRDQLSHAYKSALLVPKSGTVQENLREIFVKLREIEKTHGRYADTDSGLSTDLVLAEITARFAFPSMAEATDFTTAIIFTQKYQHLYPWAANERSKALAARKEIYQIFAKTILNGAGILTLPATDYRVRNASDEQKEAAPSELVAVLENYAKQHGIAVERVASKASERSSAVTVYAVGRSPMKSVR